jgi:hypothetical protein
MNDEQLLWDFETTRKKLAKSAHGMRWLIRNRALEIVKVGRKIYFDPKSVQAFIEKNKIPAVDNGGGK